MLALDGHGEGVHASMKVPARRRGNANLTEQQKDVVTGLNESPRPKAGKSTPATGSEFVQQGLNESPRPKAGK